MNYKIFDKGDETYFKYNPIKKFKKNSIKKVSNENPFKILKNLNPKEGVDISKFITTHKIAPNQYFIFKTGGPHFFSKCKNKDVVDPKYLDLSWPFIYNTKGTKNRIITGSIAKSKATSGYVYCKLHDASEKREMQDFRNAARKNIREVYKEKLRYLCIC